MPSTLLRELNLCEAKPRNLHAAEFDGVCARVNRDSRTAAPEVDEDAEPATQAPEFSNVTIKNPFGDGDIQIEEISLSDLPGLPELSAASRKGAPPPSRSISIANP